MTTRNALLILTLMSGCSSPGGDGAGGLAGTGSTGGGATGGTGTAGGSGSGGTGGAAGLGGAGGTGGQQGALVWAQRCEDSQVWCGGFCTVSAGAPPTPRPSCQLTQLCVHAAAAN
jgi:hypothetical protein